MQVAICIATYKRPKLLRELLISLSALQFERIPEPDIRIIVSDNDVTGSADPICQEAMKRWPVTYRIESRRGIAQARNCSLREMGSADFVVFIDDDETADPTWLEELLVAQKCYNADVVSGPVLPVFTDDAPQWIRRGGFFDPLEFQSGQTLDACATNNTLVARAVFNHVERFDDRFQLSGGEDLHFFRRVYGAGCKMVWTRNAIVRETIAADRANYKWLLRRSFRGGNGAVIVESSLDRRFTTRIKRFAKACVRIVQGAFEMLGALVRGRAQALRSLRRMSLGFGMLAGLFKFTYQAYKTTTGE